jgi:hypothetical protein
MKYAVEMGSVFMITAYQVSQRLVQPFKVERGDIQTHR